MYYLYHWPYQLTNTDESAAIPARVRDVGMSSRASARSGEAPERRAPSEDGRHRRVGAQGRCAAIMNSCFFSGTNSRVLVV